jgi:alkyl hydroperoxide reductase subunit AhpC
MLGSVKPDTDKEPAMSTALRIQQHVVESQSAAIPISTSLSRWLRGNWAVVFSHANDFACTSLESDRWLIVVKHAFASAHVRPLACARDPASLPANWILEAGGTNAIIPQDLLRSPPLASLNAYLLCEAIAHATSRFVMIIDHTLRLHKTLSYEPGARLPSPLDLAATAQRLRGPTVTACRRAISRADR